jgi:hypothetical protein
MKKTLQRFGIVTVGLSLCLWSCKEQDVILKPSDTGTAIAKEVFVKDGRLVFDSKESFWKQVDALKTPESIVAFNNKFEGFTSMKESYDELLKHDIGNAIKDGSLKNYEYSYEVSTNSDGSKEYDIAVKDNVISILLNNKGLVQMGDLIYRINDKEIIEVPEKNLNELFVQNSKNVKITIVKRIPFTDKANKSARLLGDTFGDYLDYQEYTPSGQQPRRFRTYGYLSLYGGYARCTFYVTHKRLNWYGWGNANANEWIFQVEGSIYASNIYGGQYGPGLFYTGWTGNDTGDITYNNSISISDFTGGDNAISLCTMTMRANWSARGHDGMPYKYNSDINFPNRIRVSF